MQALEGHQKALEKDVEAAQKAASDSIECLSQREDAYAANLRAQGKDETIAHLAKPEDPALMEVAPQTTSRSGDAPSVSWADQAEDADSFQRQSTKKWKRSDPKRPDSKRQNKEPSRPLNPFPLQEDARRRVEAQKCYTFSGNLGASLNDFTTAAFKKTHPNCPDKEVTSITNQVLCMIAEYHLRCASSGPIMVSPVVPTQVEHLLSPLEEYLSNEDGVEAAYTRDLREFERSRTMRVAVWLHCIDMEASSGRLSQSLRASDHTEAPLLKYFLAPGTSTIDFGGCSPEGPGREPGQPRGVHPELLKGGREGQGLPRVQGGVPM